MFIVGILTFTCCNLLSIVSSYIVRLGACGDVFQNSGVVFFHP